MEYYSFCIINDDGTEETIEKLHLSQLFIGVLSDDTSFL